MIFTLMSIVLVVSSLIAIIIYMISKEYFEDILIETAYYVENSINGRKISLGNKLVTQLIPIILGTLMLIVSVLNYMVILDKGTIQEKLYLAILKKEFSEEKKYTLEEITEKLRNIEEKNSQERITKVFAYTNDIRNAVYGKEYLNNFAIEYINTFYRSEKENIVYTEYSKNKQISILKIDTEKGSAFVGIGFRVFTTNLSKDISMLVGMITIYTGIYIWYMAYIVETDIAKVTNGMKSILKAKDNIVLNNLPILRNDEIGELVRAFNLIQKNNNNQIYRMNKVKNMMIEQERLASLGQMIGGIAHNLKTPIFSISGANMALLELTNEFRRSLDDERVSKEDFKEIAKEMEEWNRKIDTYLEYMSDIITAVKGQTTVFANDSKEYISVSDIFKTIKVLISQEMKKEMIDFDVKNYVENSVKIIGNNNILIQIIMNLIQNSIDSYEYISKNDDNRKIILKAETDEKKENIIITVEDFGTGIPKEIREKLFKEMITTKGKKGTGLRTIYVKCYIKSAV